MAPAADPARSDRNYATEPDPVACLFVHRGLARVHEARLFQIASYFLPKYVNQ